MLKILLSATVAAAMLAAMAVVPAHAAKFSSANWAQYERGLHTQYNYDGTDYYYPETSSVRLYRDTSYKTNQLISARLVAHTSSAIPVETNPISYKFGENAADYGVHQSENASYAHIRLYLATFDDLNHKLFENFYLRMDKNGTGSSRDAFVFVNSKDNMNCDFYAKSYTTSAAYTTKDWYGVLLHQGYIGNGPDRDTNANDCDARTRNLSDSDYDKIDIIVEYNKQAGATTYVFANGKFMADYYDSGLTDKHFHGIVFRTLSGKTPRNNSSYIAVKMDPLRIGHREYYDSDDYTVTMEDVMQDAGLCDSINDSSIIFKTSEVQNYMPGNNQEAYVYRAGASARERINTNVTYSGNTATIDCTNTGGSYTTAANMIAGFYPQNRLTGVSYESGHPRAKCIKLSFDQTISNDAMFLRYDTYYTSSVWALQLWKDSSSLVVQLNGGPTVTCSGQGGKPTASPTGTNHFDWILEPDETNNRINQFVYVNGKYLGSGYFGDRYAVMIADIILKTKTAAGNVTIGNWSMTVYNKYAALEAIDAAITNRSITWNDGGYELGYERKSGNINVLVTARNADGVTPNANTKVITAIYNNDGRLLDAKTDNYTGTRTLADETLKNTFTYSGDMKTIKAFVWDFSGDIAVKQTNAFTLPIQ